MPVVELYDNTGIIPPFHAGPSAKLLTLPSRNDIATKFDVVSFLYILGTAAAILIVDA